MKKMVHRARLFVRDLIQELPLVWSLARTNDCERNGGHRWQPDTGFWLCGQATATCKRCGCSQTVTTTTGTTAQFTVTLANGSN